MTAAPAGLIGASLLFWGWQTQNWAVAIALAACLEGARRTRLRFDLGAAEHARIADLCTALFVGSAALLAVNRGIAQGILAAFLWLPAALAPILAAQQFSASGRVPLSALFRHLRKQRRHDPSIADPLVDAGPVYVAIVLITAGVANQPGHGYLAGVALAVAWGLWTVRPRRARAGAWLLMLGASLAAGYAAHAGLARAQAALENWIADWYLSGYAGDPYRSTTDIGTIGRLKLDDAIVLRVFAPPGDGERARLLHRASYNAYVGTTWLARAAPLSAMDAEAGGLSWSLASVPAQANVRLAARIEHGRLLLALPSATVRLAGLAARSVKRNALGAVHAELAGDWVQYEAETAPGADTAGPPGAEELVLPAHERAAFVQTAEALALRGLPFFEAKRRIEEHFRGFAYSTWREQSPPQGATPLADFMRTSRSGHCEYFAAATTLLLRAAGIPARYATGFAVMEYSALEGAWVVRARHAHAWARAWDGARWVDLDTTPPVWFAAEEAQHAPAWQTALDLARWAAFRWSQRGELEASDAWYAVLALLVAILAWRILRGRRVTQSTPAAAATPRSWPGRDSEFYAVERALASRGLGRPPETPLASWLAGAAAGMAPASAAALREAVALHQRYRFDPRGLDREEQIRLGGLCRELAGALASSPARR